MTPELMAALINARCARAQAALLGMQAENMQRAHQGAAMAFVESDFLSVISAEGIDHETIYNALLYF